MLKRPREKVYKEARVTLQVRPLNRKEICAQSVVLCSFHLGTSVESMFASAFTEYSMIVGSVECRVYSIQVD